MLSRRSTVVERYQALNVKVRALLPTRIGLSHVLISIWDTIKS